jgi:hypothetical protein
MKKPEDNSPFEKIASAVGIFLIFCWPVWYFFFFESGNDKYNGIIVYGVIFYSFAT